MAKRTTIHDLPNELLLETFQHLALIEPLGDVQYPEDDDDFDTTSSTDSFESYTSTSVDDDYTTDSETFTDSQSLSYSFSPGYMRVTHVCSSWRRVAIDSATLWSTIPFNLCPDWVDELLRRSKEAELDLVIPQTTSHEISAAYLSKVDVYRVRQIVCATSRAAVLEQMNYKMNDPESTPALKELDLSGLSYPALILNAFKSLRRMVILLRDDDPTLPALSESIYLPSLTELKLAMVHEDRGFPMTNSWTALLENLKILELVCVPIDFSGRGEIVLPRLRELSLVEDHASCGTFLRHVRMPFLERYVAEYYRPGYPAIVDLASVRAMGFSRVLDDVDAAVPAIHTLLVTHFLSPYTDRIEIHGWRSTGREDDTIEFPIDNTQNAPRDAGISHTIDLAEEADLNQAINFAIVFLSHPAFSTLRMLSLDLHPILELGDASSWAELLQPMRHLQHLRISSPSRRRGSPMHILESLQTRQNDGEYVVPSLERLTLVDWDPDVGRIGNDRGIIPGEILRDIALRRPDATSLQAVHIVSWCRYFDARWQQHLAGVDGVKILYEHLFLSLDHVHAIEEEDSDDDDEEAETDGRRSRTSTVEIVHGPEGIVQPQA